VRFRAPSKHPSCGWLLRGYSPLTMYRLALNRHAGHPVTYVARTETWSNALTADKC
jgi:hypothetical protein